MLSGVSWAKLGGPKCPMALLVLAVLRPYLFEASRVSCLGLLSLFCQWHRMRKKSVVRQAKREKEEREALIFFFEELAMSMQSRQKPVRPWHNFRASKPVARFSGTRYISLISRFWGSKILEWPVGTRLSRNKRERGGTLGNETGLGSQNFPTESFETWLGLQNFPTESFETGLSS